MLAPRKRRPFVARLRLAGSGKQDHRTPKASPYIYRIAETSLGVAIAKREQLNDGVRSAVNGTGWTQTLSDLG
jgi:hypothetical protein